MTATGPHTPSPAPGRPRPVTVTVTGAAGQIGYATVFRAAAGDLLGPGTPVRLHLLELPQARRAAEGTALELQASTTPIMAGETRDIALVANKPGDTETAVAVRFPITITGKLEWGKNGSLPIQQRFTR